MYKSKYILGKTTLPHLKREVDIYKAFKNEL